MKSKLYSLTVTEKIVLAIFFVILIISTYLKTAPILNYNFPFTMDQARDMLDIREIVIGLHPTLIGPTTSINGVFLGPFYYYFNVIPFAISGGDPAYLVYWNILWYTFAAAAIFIFNFRRDKTFAIIASSIFMMAPALFYSARYFWSANPMPYVTTFFFLCLIYFIVKRDIRSAIIAGLISGLSMQFEAAFGVLFFPFLVLYSLLRKVPIKIILFSFFGFFITLLPQALFEFRHGFVMTKTFLNEISGQSQILGEKMQFSEAIISHWQSFMSYKNEMFTVPTEVTTTIILLAIGVLIIRFKKLDIINREYFLSSTIFIVFAFIFYSWYLHPLKGWYLLGIRVPLIFIIALGLGELFRMGNILLRMSVAGFLIYTFAATYLFQVTFIPSDYSSRSGDKSTLRNEIEAIDWVYQKANGQGFKAYNYIPSVYDYPYQYLYWWYGTNKYHYQPETITYLDGVPEYIKNNEEFLTKKRPAGEDPLVFLIYEKDENKERRAGWLGDFTEYCTVEKVDYTWETTIELRKLCRD